MDSGSSMDGGSEHSLSPGQLLLGKYRIEQVIGQGGMGLVLGATHVELLHQVAIKVLLPSGFGSEVIEARFLREAQIAASLRSENVVRVFDVGRLADNRPYMVMEWLEGRDLSAGPIGSELPIEEAVDYLVQACDAMSAAHAKGLVHRDLKPANLFLVHDEHGVPTVKILDFGISKVRQQENQNLALTEANGMMGSPLYMSPEQIRSARDVDARADIWSLGTILFELLSGKPPFEGETLGAVFVAVTQSAPRSLRELRPDIPAELDAVILRCLAKAPEQRFQRAQDLQHALLPFASPRSQAKIAMRRSSLPPGSTAMPSGVAPAASVAGSRTTGGWTDIGLRGQPRFALPLRLIVALGVASLLAVGVSMVWLARRGLTAPPVAALSSEPVPNSSAATEVLMRVADAEVAHPPTISAAAAPNLGTTESISEVLTPKVGTTKHKGAAASSAGAPPPPAVPVPLSVQPPAPQSPSVPAHLTPTQTQPAPTTRKNPLDVQFK